MVHLMNEIPFFVFLINFGVFKVNCRCSLWWRALVIRSTPIISF